MNVTAIIVTHNRLYLLKECIEAVKAQTFPVEKIVVVNNASTDGTTEWLQEQTELRVINQGNVGGSGGFHTGFKDAVLHNTEWIWGMDDDTIAQPDALEKMVQKLERFDASKVGFLCSKAVWNDGKPHLMNLPVPDEERQDDIPATAKDVVPVKSCSFVSILLNTAVVKQLGLPYKQFYIWFDDLEYTSRITRAGYTGLYCTDSIVTHKTPTNYRVDLYTDNAGNLWKHAYGIRNEMFIIKKRRGLPYFLFFAPAKVAYSTYKIVKSRKRDRVKFINVLLRSVAKALVFNPAIDRVS